MVKATSFVQLSQRATEPSTGGKIKIQEGADAFTEFTESKNFHHSIQKQQTKLLYLRFLSYTNYKTSTRIEIIIKYSFLNYELESYYH